MQRTVKVILRDWENLDSISFTKKTKKKIHRKNKSSVFHQLSLCQDGAVVRLLPSSQASASSLPLIPLRAVSLSASHCSRICAAVLSTSGQQAPSEPAEASVLHRCGSQTTQELVTVSVHPQPAI